MNNQCVSQFSLCLSPAQLYSKDCEREHRRVGGMGGRKARRAAACRMQGEIKEASPFIDCIKIGLHLQLS